MTDSNAKWYPRVVHSLAANFLTFAGFLVLFSISAAVYSGCEVPQAGTPKPDPARFSRYYLRPGAVVIAQTEDRSRARTIIVDCEARMYECEEGAPHGRKQRNNRYSDYQNWCYSINPLNVEYQAIRVACGQAAPTPEP